MFKKIMILGILMTAIVAGVVRADTLEEMSFASLNYDNFSVPRDKELCNTYYFNKLKQTNDSVLYLNLIIENYIPVKEKLSVSVYLNDVFETKIENSHILKENRIKFKGRMKEKNNVKVCLSNNVLPVVIISNNSTLGSYIVGEITPEDFYIKVLSTQTYSNTLLPIEIYAENNSPKEVAVSINYASKEFLRLSNLETVSGETSYTGVIYPGETKILKYYLKTNKNISFGTPQANLTYTNDFGETKTIYAKQKVIQMRERLDKIEVYVDLARNVNVNEEQNGKIIIRNVSEDELKNLTIETSFDNKVILSERQISVLKKYEVKEIPFKTTIDLVGNHVFNVTVYYNIGDVENGISAETTNITAGVKTDNLKEIIGVFLFITIIVYIWIVRF